MSPAKTIAERRGHSLDAELSVTCTSSGSEYIDTPSRSCTPSNSLRSYSPMLQSSTDVSSTVNVALVARIQALELENDRLRQQVAKESRSVFVASR